MQKLKQLWHKYNLYFIVFAIILGLSIIVFWPTYTENVTSTVWDGTIAASFNNGTGTQEDPYLITNGNEFAYFIANENNATYFNKYYKLTNNIDFNGNELNMTGNDINSFSGHLDGQGYTIFNFKINNYNLDNNIYEYGLFSNLVNATIENLNIHDVTLELTSINNNSYLGVLCSKASNSTFNNISLYDINYNLTNNDTSITYTGGSLIANDLGGNTITNINADVMSNNSSIGILIGNYLNSSLNRIAFQNNNLNLLQNNPDYGSDQIYSYTITNNEIYFSNNYTIDSILNYFNENSLYTWTQDTTNIRMKNNGITPNTNRVLLKAKAVSTITTHDTGIDGTTAYLNELETDYNYYMGQNYTYNTGTLPTLTNKNIYSDNNLVNVAISYNGTNITGDFTGTISLSENQNKMVYYKNYVVNNNNTPNDTTDDYINIELIDNQFTNYPTDMAFNNWITNYNGATITYDNNYYARYVKVPVSYDGTNPKDIDINLYASWTWAKVGNMGTNWSNAFNNLDTSGMHQLNLNDIVTYAPYSMNGYYHRVSLSSGQSYAGYYDAYGDYMSRGTCRSYYGCTYYQLITNENYTEGNTYYYVDDNSGYMTQLDPSTLNLTVESTTLNALKNGTMAGFFKLVNIPNGSSINNYYDQNGTIQSGTCSTSGGCSYYQMISYYQSDGTTVNNYDANTTYYYLATRDTNIIVLKSNISSTWSSSQNKPFTLTSIYNGTSYRETYYWNVSNSSIVTYADTKIENIRIYTNTAKATGEIDPSGSGSYGAVYGNWHNLKLGRGITQYNTNYVNFNYVVGGYNSSTGSSSNLTKYHLIIESGVYNSLALATGTYSSYYGNGYTDYIAGKGTYGSDYDRITSNNNLLTVVFCASGSWGNSLYSSSSTGLILDLIVKSGSFGTNKYDYTTGIYVGGRYGGTTYAARKITVEGGYIYNLIGGPLSDSSMSSYNDSYIYVLGGSIDMITGGAGRSATYGNRIIGVTGGTINYSIVGGSNGVEGSDGDGTLNGTPYVYIGGNTIVGDDTNVSNNNTLSGAEAGSVFGIGNGRSGYDSIGSCDNSNVIIDGNAIIKRNVYGGGNYGATGINSSLDTNTTNIIVSGGTINGSLYGGGNNNGAGSTSKTSTVNITQNAGSIKGSIYGGSRSLGTIYGTVNLNINGGSITTDVYGGGEGGYASDTELGTYVTKDVNVTIGTSTTSPSISGNVYGGSAYGTVNASSINDNQNSQSVNVVVNNGNITGSVFGGAKGNTTYTPHIKGNITVNINGGTIGSVYGGFDQSGTPEGTDNVYLNGGIIGSAFGGGNNTSINTSNIYLQGSSTTYLYGGSNQSGDVSTSNVFIKSGTVTSAFGGNNIGGTCAETHVTVTGGTISEELYGGGNKVATTTTNLDLESSVNTVPNVYGGGKSADATTTNVNGNGLSATNIFGGSNTSGTVTTSNVTINTGTITNVYGGNNAGGKTLSSNVTINNGNISNVYGGGNQAETDLSNVIINNGTITKAFGGGNLALTTTTNIRVNNGSISECYGGGNESGATTTNINTLGGTIGSVFGGSNQSGTVTTSNVNTLENTDNTSGITYTVTNNAYAAGWRSTEYETAVDITVNIKNNTSNPITTYNGSIYAENSKLYTNYGSTLINQNGDVYTFNQANRYYGTNTIAANGTLTFNFTILTHVATSNVKLIYGLTASDGTNNYVGNSSLVMGNIYGGNNAGGLTTNANVTTNSGLINNVYGGGNKATVGNTNVEIKKGTINNVYGGGNAAGVNTNTNLNITGGTIQNNTYGGGNEGIVSGNTNVNFNNGTVLGSVYAGGNGSTALVSGNTNINVSGSAIIGSDTCTNKVFCSVFGGGNAAPTGTNSVNSSKATVNVAGGTIYGNVYGGANTSVVNGTTEVNIGADVTPDSKIIKSDILVNGTVFGGGEANASGSETYDWNFISVTNGINVNINGLNYNNFVINGSIFGSGDASSTTGTSQIKIYNYGTYASPKKNVSIQRTNKLIIDNSSIVLKGATDRTNEYSSVLFTLSIIDELDLQNNSTLYLETGSNLLKCFKGLNADGSLATVTIDDTNKTVTKSSDNRLYMLQGKNLNIATNESVTSYGEVYGMTFFGMYSYTSSNAINTGIYNQSFNYGDTLSWGDVANNGSYVMGLHKTNHNINADGFYSNFMDEDTTTNKVKVITPTPESSDFYMWIIGDVATTYEVNLTASKYSTLGAVELSLRDFVDPNTTFSVVGFDYSNLASGVSLISEDNIPRIASSTDIADNQMGLTMKSSNTGWLTNGSTNFLSNSTNPIQGTKTYVGENSTSVPTLLFYLYHSKNLGTAGNMGSVSITLMAVHRIDDLNKETKRLVINVNLSRVLYNTNDYEAAITAGRQYSMFTSTTTNITSKSSISAYFSLYAEGASIYREGYHRAIVSSSVLPENTKMTLIDLSGSAPKYYYHTITSTDVTNATTEFNQDSEVSYNLSMFETMGAVNSGINYNDATMNNQYYNSSTQKNSEEFIVIIDFGDTNITSDSLNNSLLMEMRDAGNQTIISVLGIEHANMIYNVYANKDAVIDVNGTSSTNKLYVGKSMTVDLKTTYTESKVGSNTVYDTKYFDSKLGIKISLVNANNEVITGTSLLGLYYDIDGVHYTPNIDGTTRIKIADKVGNVETWIGVYTENANIATGQYNLRIESFGSPDGIYYGLTASDHIDIPVYIINEIYGLDVTTNDKSQIIDSTTGKNLNDSSNLTYAINYNSGLTNPNIHMKLYRRNYDTEYDTNYTLVDLKDYVSSALFTTSVDKEYLVVDNPNANSTMTLIMKNNLITGTYKLEFILYDGDSSIGTIEKYIIIK